MLIVWIVPVLAVFLWLPQEEEAGHPGPEDLNVETTVTPPPTTTPTQEVEQTAPSTTNDQTEDPLLSEDMQIVNDELRRRGFAADIYFQLDEAGLSDEARNQLQRNADLLRQAQFS